MTNFKKFRNKQNPEEIIEVKFESNMAFTYHTKSTVRKGESRLTPYKIMELEDFRDQFEEVRDAKQD